MRTRYQFGSIYLEQRKHGPAVWVYRYFENGRRRKVPIGTTAKYATKTEATKAVEGLRLSANPTRAADRAVTFGAVLDRYRQEELPERRSTRVCYVHWLNNHVEPVWRDFTL